MAFIYITITTIALFNIAGLIFATIMLATRPETAPLKKVKAATSAANSAGTPNAKPGANAAAAGGAAGAAAAVAAAAALEDEVQKGDYTNIEEMIDELDFASFDDIDFSDFD